MCPHSLQAAQPPQRVLGFLDRWCGGMTLPCSKDCMEDFERREPAAMCDGNPGGQLPVWKALEGGESAPCLAGGLPGAEALVAAECHEGAVSGSVHGAGCERVSKPPVKADQHTTATQSPEIRVLFSFIHVYYRVPELGENIQVPE